MKSKYLILRDRAAHAYGHLQRMRRLPRYRKVMGRLVQAGVLTTTEEIPPHRDPIQLCDALWAAEAEPRIIELLPALIIKTPSLFEDVNNLEGELAAVVRALRRNETPPDFHGIPGEAMARWLPLIGRQRLPSQLKSFRFTAEDVSLLKFLSARLGLNQTEVLRRGLRDLAAKVTTKA